MEFQSRLDNSVQFHSAHTEKLLLDLIMQTDSHDTAEEAVRCMNVHPLTDKRKITNSCHHVLYFVQLLMKGSGKREYEIMR